MTGRYGYDTGRREPAGPGRVQRRFRQRGGRLQPGVQLRKPALAHPPVADAGARVCAAGHDLVRRIECRRLMLLSKEVLHA